MSRFHELSEKYQCRLYVQPCPQQRIINTPPWFRLLRHCYVPATLSRGSLKTACPTEVWMSSCWFNKHQTPSQSNTNYWAGSAKSILSFQRQSQFVTGENDSDTSVHHFETVCFSLGRQYFIHGASINFHSQHQGFCDLQPYHPQRTVNIPAWLQLFRRETPSRSHLCMFRVRPYLVRPLKAVCHS